MVADSPQVAELGNQAVALDNSAALEAEGRLYYEEGEVVAMT